MKAIKLSDLEQYCGEYAAPGVLCGVDTLEQFNNVTERDVWTGYPVHCAYIRENGALVYEMKIFYSGEITPCPSLVCGLNGVRATVLQRLLNIPYEEAQRWCSELDQLEYKENFTDEHCGIRRDGYNVQVWRRYLKLYKNDMERDGNAVQMNVANYAITFKKA